MLIRPQHGIHTHENESLEPVELSDDNKLDVERLEEEVGLGIHHNVVNLRWPDT